MVFIPTETCGIGAHKLNLRSSTAGKWPTFEWLFHTASSLLKSHIQLLNLCFSSWWPNTWPDKAAWRRRHCVNAWDVQTCFTHKQTTAFDMCSVEKINKTKDIPTESRALVTNRRSSNIFASGCDSGSCSTLWLMVKPEALKHLQGLAQSSLSLQKGSGCSRVWLDSLCKPAGLSASSNLNVICMALWRCLFTWYAKNIWICLPGLSLVFVKQCSGQQPRTLREPCHGSEGFA